jgi:hypothetical protein
VKQQLIAVLLLFYFCLKPSNLDKRAKTQSLEDKPFKSDLKQPESHFKGGKSHLQILRGGDHFPKCRIYGIAIFVIFV